MVIGSEWALVITLSIIIGKFFLIVQDSNSNGFRQLMIGVEVTRNIIVFEGNEMED